LTIRRENYEKRGDKKPKEKASQKKKPHHCKRRKVEGWEGKCFRPIFAYGAKWGLGKEKEPQAERGGVRTLGGKKEKPHLGQLDQYEIAAAGRDLIAGNQKTGTAKRRGRRVQKSGVSDWARVHTRHCEKNGHASQKENRRKKARKKKSTTVKEIVFGKKKGDIWRNRCLPNAPTLIIKTQSQKKRLGAGGRKLKGKN